MEQRESAQSTLDDVAGRLSGATEAKAKTTERRDASLAELAEETARKTEARAPLVARLPADLVGLYDKVRESAGGVGAALLRRGRCEGCRLELSAGDKARVRAADPDEVVRCEECRRILVRTEESGL
jgi:predicted  nucleic acid-binding Zn-ribbon protein